MEKKAVNKINIAEKIQTSELHCLRKPISHEYPRKADTGLMIPAHYTILWSSPHDSRTNVHLRSLRVKSLKIPKHLSMKV